MEKQPALVLWFACLLLQTWWFSFTTSTSSKPSMNRLNNSTDQATLLTFKSHVTRDPNGTFTKSWNTNTSFCHWIGVSCSRRRQRVTTLDLHEMGLEGTIPPHITNLSFLVHLNLRYNSFHGHLPHELGRLRRLKELNLLGNQMEGTIPSSLAILPALTFLGLSNNSLRGEIPTVLFNISSLVVLSLAYNNLSGQLPADTGRFLPNLEFLSIYSNQISGPIPISLSNATKLQELWMSENKLTGIIPDTLGQLVNLETLILEENNLTGIIPSNIFNLSHLISLGLGSNQLSGQLPLDTGNWLPNIYELVLGGNRLSGPLPISLGNASTLSMLDLAINSFSGPVPATLGKLQLLERLALMDNRLTNEPGTNELKFLTYFTNCKVLEHLSLSLNPLHGTLPSSVGNFSTLREIYAYRCQIVGKIPMELGNLSSLITLLLFANNLSGTIPSTIGRLEKLQRLDLGTNMLEGSIPIEFNRLRNMGELYLDENELSGDIPDLFQNISRLQIVTLSNNKLRGIPPSLWTLQDLMTLNLAHNLLRGFIPREVGNLKKVETLDLSANQFDGSIPNSMGHLQVLQYLDLSSNSLEGPIPQSFGGLISINFMDLSSNHINGTIPKSLENFRYLESLNLSFNNLEGEIPNRGVFTNLTLKSYFMGNSKLCSAPNLHIKLNVSVCLIPETKPRAASTRLKIIISTLVVTTFVVGFSLLMIYYGKKKKTVSLAENSPTGTHKMISYQELLHATDKFSEANLLGVGGFGSVYKGKMADGSLVAVKVLSIQSEGAWKSFDAECEVMRNVRHRNLVKVITSCSNLDFRALVLQYMPNGSLDQWLYSHNNFLSLLQRIEIMLDVASAMEYLHHHYSGPVVLVHCDLKPSNVLLDEDMTAHVSDFGISKLLDANKSATRTNTLGTIGYVAPEYGLEGKVSTKGDVYSYGILLLEILVRKKPTDSMFIGGLSLRQWVNASFPDAIMDVVDVNLLRETNSSGNNVEEVDDPRGRLLSCLLSIAEVGLLCSMELAEERISMKDVMVKLMKIKNEYLST